MSDFYDIIIINPTFLSYCYLSKQRSSFFQYVPFCILICHVSHRNMPSFARQKVAYRIILPLFYWNMLFEERKALQERINTLLS